MNTSKRPSALRTSRYSLTGASADNLDVAKQFSSSDSAWLEDTQLQA